MSIQHDGHSLTRKLVAILVAALFASAALAAQGSAGITESTAEEKHKQAPGSVEAEHRHIHAELAKVIQSGGQTAAEGRNVEKLLRPHFAKEEQFALPPLVALPDIAAGRVPANAAEIIQMSGVLQKGMPAMLAEHEAIGKAVARLRAAAQKERKPQAEAFAEQLRAHAKQEEEILYPAAIIAGKYLETARR